MEYKGYTIYANAKSYSLWSVDENGSLYELEHEFEGYDLLSYTFGKDLDSAGMDDFETLEACKRGIDKYVQELAKVLER